MNARRLAAALTLGAVLWAVPASAQDEGQLRAEFRREGERLREKCGEFAAKTIFGCAAALVTDHPLHIAIGSIAPQNGFAAGLAFTTRRSLGENWRASWNADGVGTVGGAWRAGGYMKLVRTAVAAPVVARPGSGASSRDGGRVYPVVNLYAQAISLPTLSFFGIGPDSLRADKTVFGMRQTVVGADAIVPMAAVRGLNLSLLAEVNGRFVDIKGVQGEDVPSIEALFTEATAPGLASQPGVLQFGEGVRVKPVLAGGHVRLNYAARFQQFLASDSAYSFRRWSVDLGHEFPIYRTDASIAGAETNGPDECARDADDACPISRNRTGTIGIRLFASRSQTSSTSVVPFYFQQTLGGSDVNGQRGLASYEDYRFRAPSVLLLQQSFEHSIWGPIGALVFAEQGRVSLQQPGPAGSDLLRSAGLGLTVRAGGIPAFSASWVSGGAEGHHVIVVMSTTLLGGSSRPSLH